MRKVIALSVLCCILLASCRNNPDNAKGLEGILAVDWEEIHAQRMKDSVGEVMCMHLFLNEKASHDSVKYWLDKGADPNHVFTFMDAQLKASARIPVVKWFVKDKYDETEVSVSALSLAVSHHDLELVDMLLMAGGDLNLESGFAGRPIDEAIRLDDLKLVHALVDRGAKVQLAHLSYTSNLKMIDSLMAMGADGNTIGIDEYIMDEDYASLKHVFKYKKVTDEVNCFAVVRFTGEKMLKFLLENGMSPNAKCKGSSDGALLIVAASAGEKGMTDMLLKAGANPNVKDVFKKTPLHMVAADGDSATANLMLANHVNLHPGIALGDLEGPIEGAVRNDNLQMVAWLLAHDKDLKPATVKALLAKHSAPEVEAWMKGR